MSPRVLAVSRPVGKGEDTAEIVRSYGWTPFIFHTVELRPVEARRILDRLGSVLSQGPVEWIVFMSSTGVELFFDSLPAQSCETLSLQGTRFLAVGPKTREHLVARGVKDVQTPDRYSSSGVEEWFSRLMPRPDRIVLVRSSSADDRLANSLRSRGTSVATLNVYESVPPRDPRSVFEFLKGLRAGRFGAVLFTSAISVSNFFKIAEMKLAGSEVTSQLRHVVVGAIGPVTAEPLRERGIETIVPDEYLFEKAVAKLISKCVEAQAA